MKMLRNLRSALSTYRMMRAVRRQAEALNGTAEGRLLLALARQPCSTPTPAEVQAAERLLGTSKSAAYRNIMEK